MSIKKFITDMLNVDPEKVESVESVNSSDGSVTVRIKLVPDPGLRCPFCGGALVGNGSYAKKLVHSTLANRPCYIIFQRRRFMCFSCEITVSEKNPFSLPGENITHETKMNVLKDLKEASATYSVVARRYNISPTAVTHIFDRHVSIPRKPLPEVLSLDEHYFPGSDFDSLYICILMDFNTGVITDILPDRKKDYLVSYFSGIRNDTLDPATGKSELDTVKYVSIDLYDTYRDIAGTYFSKAVVCADSFHVLEHLSKGFRSVRLKCRRQTEDEDMQYLLTKFKRVFEHGWNLDNTPQYNKRFRRYMNYRDIINILFDRFPQLKQAYLLKESYMEFNSSTSLKDAPEKLAEQIKAFGDSGIQEYAEFYNLLINWNREIVNSFTLVKGRRINNSYIESRNSQIEKLFINANGFRNFKRTRQRILYCLNKDDTFKM
jgi:transposase